MTQPTCSVDDCPKKRHAKGLCGRHYMLKARNGDPSIMKQVPWGERLRFVEAAVAHSGDECLIWPFGVASSGYAQVRIGGKVLYAHRVVLERTQGPPPAGTRTEAAHAPVICHNRRCLNPAHLRWDTPSENSLDKFNDGTHRRGERNNMARLTWAQVGEIRTGNGSVRDLAEKFGVTPETIRNVLRYKTWRTER